MTSLSPSCYANDSNFGNMELHQSASKSLKFLLYLSIFNFGSTGYSRLYVLPTFVLEFIISPQTFQSSLRGGVVLKTELEALAGIVATFKYQCSHPQNIPYVSICTLKRFSNSKSSPHTQLPYLCVAQCYGEDLGSHPIMHLFNHRRQVHDCYYLDQYTKQRMAM